ncbi:GGDEF domain-containing protein, partial [Bacillus sp. JJ722]|uniref:GGDEF domain-containing protein n=1 Tax=Bacillus sp. JJ722 TaxID=3122973 RepID=UPI002FFEB864
NCICFRALGFILEDFNGKRSMMGKHFFLGGNDYLRHDLSCEELQIAKLVVDKIIKMAIIDTEGRFIYVNDRYVEFTNYTREYLYSQDYWSLNAQCHSKEFLSAIQEKIRNGEKWVGEICNCKKSGEFVWLKVTIIPLTDERGNVIQHFIHFSETNNQVSDENWKYKALHDELTGLPNRRMLNQCFDLYISEANQRQTKFAVLFVDLDYFKDINDRYGHIVGDLVLKEVANRLRMISQFSNKDQIFRQSGDEFIILLDDVENLRDKTDSIIALFNDPFVVNSQTFYVHISIGISIFPDHARERDTLIEYADKAMYKSKNDLRSNYKMYQSSLEGNH